MPKDDKGEFEYVELTEGELKREPWYKKVYLDKQIDWSKVDSTVLVFVKPGSSRKENPSFLFDYDMQRNMVKNNNLAFNTSYLHANPGHCPLPEGVMIEVVFRGGIDFSGPIAASELNWDIGELYPEEEDLIISTYRITGLADGWKH